MAAASTFVSEAIVLMPFLNLVPAGSVVNAPRPANA